MLKTIYLTIKTNKTNNKYNYKFLQYKNNNFSN